MSAVVETPRDDISLVAMLHFIGRHLGVIALCVLGFTVAAVFLAFSLKPMYRAEVVAFPAESGNGMSALGNQLGGLASLAGVNLGGGGGKKSDEALEFLRSRSFTAAFIQRHGLMPILFAKKWDTARNQWRDPDDVPSIAEGVAKFSKKVRQVAEDKRTGMVTLSIIWSDRVAAAEWANALIAEADKALRERAIAEQGHSIEYLKAEAAQTSTVEIGNAISKLMETELKNSMLARTRDAYAFNVLDPAVVRDPKDRDSPNKPLIVVLGAGLGFVVGVIVGAVRQSRYRPANP
jgi:uncharacterized protein involved in exopolysaccharide biosynthesis